LIEGEGRGWAVFLIWLAFEPYVFFNLVRANGKGDRLLYFAKLLFGNPRFRDDSFSEEFHVKMSSSGFLKALISSCNVEGGSVL